MERHSVQAELPRPEHPEAARLDVPAGFRREHLKARYPARPSAAAARKVRAPRATEEAEAMAAQRLAQAERLVPPALQAAVRGAQQALGVVAAQLPEAAAVRDAAAGPQPAAESAGAARRREAAAVQGAAEVAQRRAGPASEAVLPQVAEVPAAVAARLRVAEALDAGALRPAARDGAARPSAAAWAGLPSTRCRGDRPAPSAPAQSAHAGGCLRTAQR
jgi:hypothetical protein